MISFRWWIIPDDVSRWGVRKSQVQIKTAFELCEMEIHQKILMSNCKKMMKRSIDQKLRLRNFDVRHWKIETRAMTKSRKDMSDVVRDKEICYQWKEKDQCSKGDMCCCRHESNDDPPKSTQKAISLSKSSVTRGKKCREKEVSETEVSRADTFTKETCTKSLVSIDILPNVIFLQNRDAK